MPERQSSTDEETARPATDGGNGSGDRTSGSADGAPGGAPVNGNGHGNGAAPEPPAPVADQVAAQVAAEPGAGEPAAVGADGRPAGDDPVVTGVESDAAATTLFEPPARPVVTEAGASLRPVAGGDQAASGPPAGNGSPAAATRPSGTEQPAGTGVPAATPGADGPTGNGPTGTKPAGDGVAGNGPPGTIPAGGSAGISPVGDGSSDHRPAGGSASAVPAGTGPDAPGASPAPGRGAPGATGQPAAAGAGTDAPGTGRPEGTAPHGTGPAGGEQAAAGRPAGAQPGPGQGPAQSGTTQLQQPPTGRPGPAPAGHPDPSGRPGEASRDATVRTPLPPATAAQGSAAAASAAPSMPGSATAAPAGSTEAPTRPTARPETPAAAPRRDGPTVAVALPTGNAESTQVIPVSQAAAPVDPPTERLQAITPAARPPVPPVPPQGGGGSGSGRRRRMPLLIGAAAVAAVAALYVGDLVLTSGSVPRGTTVAGVDVGGLALADAEQELRAAIEPRATQPVPVTAGEVTSEIDPVAAGLTVDWAGTLDQAGDQPLNPFTRIASFFSTSRTLGVVTTADDQALTSAVEQLGPVVDTQPVEGTVRFEGVTPVPVQPVPGQQLDPPAAVQAIKANWASGVPVALPLISLPALTTPEDVDTALTDVAVPAVSGPVTVVGEQDTEGVLDPEVIAAALSFEPAETGELNPVLNPTVVTDALEDQLAASEVEARDAELDFSTTPATVVPSQDGRGVDYEATLADLLPVLTGTGEREITAVYAAQPADLTTDELSGLGNAGEISTFTTGGFAQDSGVNIRRAAELVDGTVVGPGETFSLDAVTGPRTAANGYVEAGVIDNGRAGRGIAGGVSQVSTTTYNAAYFAGMTDVEHRPHSFYISRYPEGREATIVTGALDMRFRNDTPTAVLIRTAWTPTSVTVTFFGTKYYDVSSSTSERSNFTSPNTVNVPEGEPCNPSQGAQGFTVTDTRTLRNLQTGEVTSESQTTRYNPAPIVVCGG